MKANVRLGRIWNIPIGLNGSWFLIFALSTWSLSMGFFPAAIPGLQAGVYWLLGALTSVLFFGSVLAHELGHAFLALRNSVPVRAITLFFFGGVAEITREPRSAGAEFRIAIAGPLAGEDQPDPGPVQHAAGLPAGRRPRAACGSVAL